MNNLKIFNEKLFKEKIVPISISVSLLTGGFTFFIIDKSKDAQYVKVPNSIANSIYYDNNFMEIIKSNDYQIKNKGNNKDVDPEINNSTLSQINNLSIDLSLIGDFSFLKYCKNLKCLTIESPQKITEEGIKEINNLDLEELRLHFKENEIFKEKTIKNDLIKKLKCENIKLDFSYIAIFNELEEYGLYVYKNKYFDNKASLTSIDCEKYEKIDNKIDELIQKYNLKKEKDDKDTVINIIFALTDYFTYDKKIKKGVEEDDEAWIDYASYYNEYALSSTLLETNGVGVCINFTAILNAICYKFGISAYSILGSQDEYGHAVSLIKIDDDYTYVDLTRIEADMNSDYSFEKYIYEVYENEKDKETKEAFYDELKKLILEFDANDVKDYFTPAYNIENITNETKYIYTDKYINNKVEGKEVPHKKNLTTPFVLALGNGLIVYLLPEILKRKRINEKNIKINNKTKR